ACSAAAASSAAAAVSAAAAACTTFASSGPLATSTSTASNAREESKLGFVPVRPPLRAKSCCVNQDRGLYQVGSAAGADADVRSVAFAAALMISAAAKLGLTRPSPVRPSA
ncbi:hypothetical protein Vafri_16945, partial [Volvox africanus]